MSLREILKSRVYDNEQQILQALYDSPELLLPSVSNISFVIEFSNFIVKQDLSRSLLRLHFKFICGAYCDANPSLVTPVLLHVVFPFLLFTKPRQKSAAAIWGILKKSVLAEHKLLKGSFDTLQGELEEEKDVDRLSTFNSRLADQIASLYRLFCSRYAIDSQRITDTLRTADDITLYTDWLYTMLICEDTHSRLFGWLIARSLVIQMRKEPKMDLAKKFLELISESDMNELSEMFVLDGDQVSVNLVITIYSRAGLKASPFRTIMKVIL